MTCAENARIYWVFCVRARCRLRARLRRTCAPCGRNPRRRRGRTSRRGRWHGCPVERRAVAAFILSTVPGPCSSWRACREDREAVAVCMAMPRGAFWRCFACGQSFVGGMGQSARRKMNGGSGARINTGAVYPLSLRAVAAKMGAGFFAWLPCPWGQCGVPRLLAASIIGARVNSSEYFGIFLKGRGLAF